MKPVIFQYSIYYFDKAGDYIGVHWCTLSEIKTILQDISITNYRLEKYKIK